MKAIATALGLLTLCGTAEARLTQFDIQKQAPYGTFSGIDYRLRVLLAEQSRPTGDDADPSRELELVERTHSQSPLLTASLIASAIVSEAFLRTNPDLRLGASLLVG